MPTAKNKHNRHKNVCKLEKENFDRVLGINIVSKLNLKSGFWGLNIYF